MKISILTLLIASVLLTVGCRKQPEQADITGKWQGYVTEDGKSTLVELVLEDEQGTPAGKLTVLGQTGEDVDEGATFEIVQAEQSGGKLKFVVPITGEFDDDAIAFELLIEQGRLRGTAHELREGSPNLAITFERE
jgi:hypothetical protein